MDQERRVLPIPRFFEERRAPARQTIELHEQRMPLRGLQRVREARGWTLGKLALRTGLPSRLLGELEARVHAPSPHTCALLMQALGVELEVLT